MSSSFERVWTECAGFVRAPAFLKLSGLFVTQTSRALGAGRRESQDSYDSSSPNWPRPMAPARTSGRRAQRSHTSRKQHPQQQNAQPQQLQSPPLPSTAQQPLPPSLPDDQDAEQLFLDPMSGQPLQLYIEKDVDNRDTLVESIIVSLRPLYDALICGQRVDSVRELMVSLALWRRCVPGVQRRHIYSGCVSSSTHAYNEALMANAVDPLKESGQNLYRQYAGKKNKMILSYQWVYSCIRDKTLHGFATNWAGCKVTGQEQ